MEGHAMTKESTPKYPFIDRGALELPRASRAIATEPLQSSGDGGPDEARRDLNRARGQLTRVPRRGAPPRWVLSFVERRANPDELVNRLRARASSLRTARTQSDALAILNELGRSPRTAALARDALTTDILAEVVGEVAEAG
jgi:hypothetical protein